MTWRYGVRQRRLVEIYYGLDGVPGIGDREPGDEPYAVLGWSDVPQILRDWRWVIGDLWRGSKRRAA